MQQNRCGNIIPCAFLGDVAHSMHLGYEIDREAMEAAQTAMREYVQTLDSVIFSEYLPL